MCSQAELLDPGEPLEENLLSVRKSAVGRTHSLPNDSYMFLQPGAPALTPGDHALTPGAPALTLGDPALTQTQSGV